MSNTQTQELNSTVSAVLSFLILGVGHIVINGQTGRGALWLLGGGATVFILAFFIIPIVATLTLGVGLVFYPLLLVVPAGAAYDAYNQAEKINAGKVTV
ncbi:hypothetical protein HKK80_09820 [Halonotius sp. F2-221B]|uniref:hypothetical protein n=1 Tax=Halonotius sp. F2-221B TaxID=2731620 RepID=UPI00398A5B3E